MKDKTQLAGGIRTSLCMHYTRLAFYQGTALEPLLHPINVDGTISVEKEPGRGRPGVGTGERTGDWILQRSSVYYNMIKDPQYHSRIKARLLASDPLDLAQKYAILESLYNEACELGKFGPDDLLLGLEDDIRLAAALNANPPNTSR